MKESLSNDVAMKAFEHNMSSLTSPSVFSLLLGSQFVFVYVFFG
jgi:hypothetical protein